MVDAANEALSFVAKKSRTELATDRALALALVKSIEILGEAASKVSARSVHNLLRFPGLTSSLCVIDLFSYFDVNLDIVWQTVTVELPPLVDQVEKLLATSEVR
jgi:uncharacterized protein with HEPN domain